MYLQLIVTATTATTVTPLFVIVIIVIIVIDIASDNKAQPRMLDWALLCISRYRIMLSGSRSACPLQPGWPRGSYHQQ